VLFVTTWFIPFLALIEVHAAEYLSPLIRSSQAGMQDPVRLACVGPESLHVRVCKCSSVTIEHLPWLLDGPMPLLVSLTNATK
jgi:hypothetical protein